LNLDLIVFDGDRDLRASLMADKEFARAVKESNAQPLPPARKDLLETAVQLSPKMSPALYRLVERARAQVGVQAPVEVFCFPDPEINAFIIPSNGDRISVALSSAAAEKLDDAEILFVLGHEFGHALFNHLELHQGLVDGNETLAPVQAMKFYAWHRYAELSADRMGLLACDDFGAAVKAFFKLSSGLSDPRFLQDISESTQQYVALQAESQDNDPMDWYATHPYSPFRVKALDLFHRSQAFHRVKGRTGGTLSDKDLNAEVTQLVSLMNPTFLDDKHKHRKEILEFLALGGLEIAAADGKVSRSELKVIQRVAQGLGAAHLEELFAMNAEQHDIRIAQAAGTINLHLSPIRRHKLVEDLTAVALADRKLEQHELQALYGLAGMLDVEPDFVDASIGRPGRSLD
jgi:uncharacterized tellurite resistance protein B-like protein